ncbi:hypothetical protein A2911_02815 [Candidatus Nomurabacteria bacterium RIFCSPLOWO2_01_FULL_40_15]|uniref:Uncharacterized protein n=1 Tax=Candidatus Nomurabacteria bacterium RIFCSPLOWO2_01_FULL_40_15 TaxID=1801772 RepID=A0A1F6X941_9BACT|nr:MAG: hypothetical protein A2911_02815 [Candidatus Nomurabacteria bacterium RIFCSPLOWO2_01_FULL_40_15]
MRITLKKDEKFQHCVECQVETPHVLDNDGKEVCTGRRPGYPEGPCREIYLACLQNARLAQLQ